MADGMVVPRYSESKLRRFVADMPRFMVDPEEIRHVPKVLSDCGIRYVVVETLPKADIDGVCFWIDDAAPVIGMTTRHDRIDNFCSCCDTKSSTSLIRTDAVNYVQRPLMLTLRTKVTIFPLEEMRANQAAGECCVPRQELESFYVRKFPYISERDMLGFAKRVQRHPGIVVGQLQRKMNRYDWLARYKVKIRQFVISAANVDGWGVAAPISL